MENSDAGGGGKAKRGILTIPLLFPFVVLMGVKLNRNLAANTISATPHFALLSLSAVSAVSVTLCLSLKGHLGSFPHSAVASG